MTEETFWLIQHDMNLYAPRQQITSIIERSSKEEYELTLEDDSEFGSAYRLSSGDFVNTLLVPKVSSLQVVAV